MSILWTLSLHYGPCAGFKVLLHTEISQYLAGLWADATRSQRNLSAVVKNLNSTHLLEIYMLII